MAKTGKVAVQVIVSPAVLEQMEELVENGMYSSISDLWNCAINRLIEQINLGADVPDIIRRELDSPEMQEYLKKKVRAIIADILGKE